MTMEMKQITVQEVSSLLENKETILLDVRTLEEYGFANIGGVNIPLDELEARFTELDKSKKILCLCHHGVRSGYAQGFLLHQGFLEVYNIVGGIDAWSCEIDHNIKRY